MSGLLSGVLPAVYGASNKLKRNVNSLLADPKNYLATALMDANTRAGTLLDATRAATDEDLASSRAGGSLFANGPANQLLAGMMADAYNPAGMMVYHGSPHKFVKFDASKIGTGEGAQAYGHGIYTAESPKVAQSYADSVSRLHGATTTIDGAGKSVPVPLWAADRVRDEGIDSLINEWSKRLAESENAAKKSLQPWIEQGNAARFAQQLDELRAIKAAGGGTVQAPGNLYKVDLPDNAIAKMLDWDKPLSQQPENVRAAFHLDKFPDSSAKDLKGFEAYVRTGEMLGEPTSQSRKAAEHLRRKGIPGIRYLDGGSRGVGQGTSNFVVFPGNENLLTILERNGVPMR